MWRNGAVPPEIQTPRLLLRRWRVEEAPALRRVLDESEAFLRPWLRFMRVEPRSLAETARWIDEHIKAFESGANYRYAIWFEGRLIGEVMLMNRQGPDEIELAYWLHVRAVHQGFITEACRGLVPLAFQVLGRARVLIVCDERNLSSHGVANRLGATVSHSIKDKDGVLLRVWMIEAPAP
jgi:ribosomal-protein-serine acetyltransferase